MALMHVSFYSEILSLSVEMDVILPQARRGKLPQAGLTQDGQFKALYLLHGYTDDQTSWQRRSSIERYVEQLGVAVIMPTTHLGFYTDTTYGMNYFTFLSEELPQIVGQFFPRISTKPEDALVAGFSMGGYGAWKLALGSTSFGAAAALSGTLDIQENYVRHMKDSERVQTLYRGIFGEEKDLVGSCNDIMALLQRVAEEKKPLPRLYSWCGTEDGIMYKGNQKVWKHLHSLGLEATIEESEGGHQWRCWDKKIQDVLRWWLNVDMDLE